MPFLWEAELYDPPRASLLPPGKSSDFQKERENERERESLLGEGWGIQTLMISVSRFYRQLATKNLILTQVLNHPQI